MKKRQTKMKYKNCIANHDNFCKVYEVDFDDEGFCVDRVDRPDFCTVEISIKNK